MARVERPLSPHWQVYRWQITNTVSILHRLTGLMLSLGSLVLTCWLIALATGPAAYADVQAVFASTWFKIPLAGWAFCFFYHLANGIRHLFWDLGLGFEMSRIRLSGWAVVVVALAAGAAYSVVAIV
jgi:succinate dehydrogenase / fumarate reductase cytochrome b subunit